MGFAYSYDSHYMPGATDGVGAGVLLVLLAVWFLTFGLSILVYVFQSIGLHSIAGRRGIRKAWLAWLPLGNMWILGSISDQYQYVVKGNVRNRRKVLLGLTIAMWAITLPLYVSYGVFLVGMVSGFMADGNIMAAVLVMIVLALALAIVGIIAVVYQYIALFDLYSSCSPDSAVLMLVLSIFVNITMPFFLFAIRKRDGGMPPRKPPVETVYQPLPEQPMEFTEE